MDKITEEIKLPKAFKKKWLKALRSGDYGQLTGALTDGKGNYCCLGVACNVAGYEDSFMKLKKEHYKHNSDLYAGLIDMSQMEELPSNVPDLLKCDLDYGKSNKQMPYPIKELTAINDMSDSFDEIIEWIDENL